MRWLLIFFLSLLAFGLLRDKLQRLGLGKLPGDFTLRIGKREVHVPLMSSLLLSLLALLIGTLV